MDIASRAGRPDLEPTVADNIIRSQGNYNLTAMTLEQLSQVLAGELAYKHTIMYHNVVQRQDLKQLWILFGVEDELPGYWDAFTEMLFEVTRWQMELVARSMAIA